MSFRSVAVGVVFSVLSQIAPASAAEVSHTLLIGGDDGYGTSACLAEGAACGQIVADALCESHGFSKAQAFHKAEPEEMTGSIGEAPVSKDAFLINCGE